MKIDLHAKSDLRRFALYLPNKDRNGAGVADLESWITEACGLLAKLNGGVTRLAPATGMWMDSESGTLIEETTHVVCSYVSRPELAARFPMIREFIERFRTATDQDAVAIEFDGRMYFISAPLRPGPASAGAVSLLGSETTAVQKEAADGRLTEQQEAA